MSRWPKEAPEDPVDLERLVIDTDYRREVMLRLKAESVARRASRASGETRNGSGSRKD